VTILLGT